MCLLYSTALVTMHLPFLGIPLQKGRLGFFHFVTPRVGTLIHDLIHILVLVGVAYQGLKIVF